MADLLQKHQKIAERHAAILAHGHNAVGLKQDHVVSPTRGIVNGKSVIFLGTNNYLGLTFDAECIASGQRALELYGTGTTGSRIANGSYRDHYALEEELADFLDRKHCITFTTGYQANLGIISGLAGPKDTIFIDSDSHASIYDGCALSGAKIVRFRHNDAKDLKKRLERHAQSQSEDRGALVVLEGLYSIIGDCCPLEDFVALKSEHDFQILLDEAHSFGVFGKSGRGVAEEMGLEEACDFIVGTFSKSLGSVGGFAASNHPLFETLRFAMKPYMFTASSCPATVATTRTALKRMVELPDLRTQIWENIAYLFEGLVSLGFEPACKKASPVIALVCRDEDHALTRWNFLLREGVYVNIAIPPGTPNGLALLRCSVSAAHTTEEIDWILTAFTRLKEKEG